MDIPVVEEPEWEPIIEQVEPEWEPIIEKVDPVSENIRLIKDEKKPIIQPILEEKVKIDVKKMDEKASKDVDVIATVPDIDHLITKVTDNEIDNLVNSVPAQKLVKDMSKDEDVDKFITKVSNDVQS